MMPLRPRLATFVICGLLPSLLFAGQLPHRFTLGRYIPGDVWIYAHVVDNPERAWLDEEWGDVVAALEASGVDEDILALALSLVGEKDVEKWKTLFRTVQWGELFGTEMAFAERIGSAPIHLDYIVLARSNPQTAEANAKALAVVLSQLAASLNTRCDVHGKLIVQRYKRHGANVWGMCLGPLSGAPIKSIELFQKGDVVGLTTGPEAVEEILGLMVNKPKKRAIVNMPRFQEAMSRVTLPEDHVSFFDFKRLFKNVNALVDSAVGKVHGDEKGVAGKARAIAKLVGLINVLDSLVITGETQGRRHLTHTVARFQDEKSKCALASCFLDRKLFERFDEFVPIDAVGFRVDGFLNVEGLYKFATDFVEKELPRGPELLAKWTKTLAKLGFDPQADLFSWWGGEMVTVTLPAAASLRHGKDWVLMFRVKDSRLAAEKLDAGLRFLSDFVQGVGQMLMILPAPVKADGFREIVHPMVLTFARPVIGVKGSWLMVGSSAAAINKCLDVAAGRAPSIRENDRFKRDGWIPDRPVLSASYRDMTQRGQELAATSALLGMMGMGIAVNAVVEDPEAREVMDLAVQLVAIVGKLPPALQRIDFYRSESSWQVYEGEGTIRTEQVITYRAQLPEELEAAATRLPR